jgi:DNA-binding NarL/FixJ family response regulator
LSQLVHDGLTNREIANVLMVSPKTVEVYLSRLFAKTGCASRIELAVAVSEGRVGPAT